MLSLMSLDELNRVLAISKWILGILALLTALAGIFNQWVSDRIGVLQAEQKVESQKKLAASESELRQTKAKTEQLEARLAPRELSAAQVQSIGEYLKAYSGTQFQFVSYQDDPEVKGLVLQLIQLLQQAEWKGLPAQEFLMASLVVGVTVEYAPASKETLEKPAVALADVLNRNGITSFVVASPELAERADRIRIMVGKKPG